VSKALVKFLAVALVAVTISSCKSCNNDKPHIAHIDIDMNVLRLEQDMKGLNKNYDSAFAVIDKRYSDFLPFFLKMVAQVIPPRDTTISRDTFLRYVNDPYIKALRDTVSVRFDDIAPIEKELTQSFRYYRFYFPEAPIPTVVTYIDGPPYGFTYDVNYLGIGLDGYLGEKSIFYQAMAEPIPYYIERRMKPEYIVPNSMNVWLTGIHDFDMNGHKLVDAMVFKGKVLYAMKKVLPDAPDSLVFGYSDSTLTWVNANEPEIWRFFIKNELLYSTDPMKYGKYVNDAPSTSGMPPQAPGNLGSWIGYRIVEKYMAQHEEITLPQLFAEQDAQKILTESRYKP
jgi:hypothetical protein